jgi:hypothetical protein
MAKTIEGKKVAISGPILMCPTRDESPCVWVMRDSVGNVRSATGAEMRGDVPGSVNNMQSGEEKPTGDPFKQADQAMQVELKTHGDAWLAARAAAGKPGMDDIGTMKEFSEVLRVKHDELLEKDQKNRNDLIRQARGTYNPITHRFEGGKDLE